MKISLPHYNGAYLLWLTLSCLNTNWWFVFTLFTTILRGTGEGAEGDWDGAAEGDGEGGAEGDGEGGPNSSSIRVSLRGREEGEAEGRGEGEAVGEGGPTSFWEADITLL